MRVMNAAVLLAGMVVAGSAYGDAIVSGSVSNQSLSGPTCSSSASSGTSISLGCGAGGTDGSAQVSAAVTPLTASMLVSLSSYEDPGQPGMSMLAEANLSFVIDGTYVLTGGTGYGTVIWTADSFRYGEGGGGMFGACSITIADVTQVCDLNAGVPLTGTFVVPYDTPVSLVFSTSYMAAAQNFDDVYSGMNFDIDPMTPVDSTPEPATWVFFAMSGAMVYGLHRRQVRALR